MTSERRESWLNEAAERTKQILGKKLNEAGDRNLTLDEIEDLVETTGREVDRWVQGRLIEEQTPPTGPYGRRLPEVRGVRALQGDAGDPVAHDPWRTAGYLPTLPLWGLWLRVFPVARGSGRGEGPPVRAGPGLDGEVWGGGILLCVGAADPGGTARPDGQ